MPKLIDYPRTTYASAWEVAEVVDDTGGKCALETCARKLDRKVSGSFKAIVGSAVKFGLLTSKRELLSTTTLFRRIKHAYDKQEELLFHREAFLTPPLFTQLCRKFRQRELPVQMLDVMLIREFDVEEINAAAVAKAFAEGARAVGLLDEHNTVADIDQLAAQAPPRRELASPAPATNSFRAATTTSGNESEGGTEEIEEAIVPMQAPPHSSRSTPAPGTASTTDAVASLFGLGGAEPEAPRVAPVPAATAAPRPAPTPVPVQSAATRPAPPAARPLTLSAALPTPPAPAGTQFTVRITGPGIDTQLEITHEDDLLLVQGFLEKIRRQLRG
ncbi:hypothetical protein [Hymenobacter sp. PAMC 26628]|uniref:hypothetical protein n=1 Tax=Hymenobacter sp. PAMC 26628 TaxID=1484118 RepID=UPI00077015B0|nr:hypothetical protein [Hymenobacter sp. PAMC 26628]AMJ65571.1 hypothetical protein AXW84_09105 [Hymenobacter sp. PAMC 26628]